MARKNIHITGVDELARKLHRLAPKVQRKVVHRAIKTALGPVETETKILCPVRSGTMRGLIGIERMTRTRSRNVVGYEVVVKGSDGSPMVKHTKDGQRVFVPYAVEFGHKNAPPHAFFRPAFESKGQGAKAACIALLRAGIEKEARS